jgi:hypothetical protein
MPSDVVKYDTFGVRNRMFPIERWVPTGPPRIRFGPHLDHLPIKIIIMVRSEKKNFSVCGRVLS